MPSHGENTADLKIIRESIQDFQISSAVTQNNLDAQKMHEHYMTFDDEHMKSRYASELRRIWNETTNNLDGTYLDTSNTGKYPLGSEAKEKADKENENLKAFVQLFDELLEDETPGSGLHTYGVASNTSGKYHGINAAEAVAWMAFGGLSGNEMPLTSSNELDAAGATVPTWTVSQAADTHTGTANYEFVDNVTLANAHKKLNIKSGLARIVSLYAIWYKHGVVSQPLFASQANNVDKITVTHFQLLSSSDTDNIEQSTYGPCNRYGYCEILTASTSATTFNVFTNDSSGRRYFAALLGALLNYENLVGGASRTKFFGGEAEYTMGMLNTVLASEYRNNATNGFSAADIKTVFRSVGSIGVNSSIASLNETFSAKLETLDNLNIYFAGSSYTQPAHVDITDTTTGAATQGTTDAYSASTATGYGHASVTAGTMAHVFGGFMIINAVDATTVNGATTSGKETPFLKTVLDRRCLYAPTALKKMFGNSSETDIDLSKVGLAVEIGALQNNGQLIKDTSLSAESAWYSGFVDGLEYLNRARQVMTGQESNLTWRDILEMHKDSSSLANEKLLDNFLHSVLKLKKWGPNVTTLAAFSDAGLSSLDNTETMAESLIYLPKRDEMIANAGSNPRVVDETLFVKGSASTTSPIDAHLWTNALRDLLKHALVEKPSGFKDVVKAVGRLQGSVSGDSAERAQIVNTFDANAPSGSFGGAAQNDDTRGCLFATANSIDFDTVSRKVDNENWLHALVFLNVSLHLTESQRATLYKDENHPTIAKQIASLVKYQEAKEILGVYTPEKLIAVHTGMKIAKTNTATTGAYHVSKTGSGTAAASGSVEQPFPLVAGSSGYSTITGQFDNSWFVFTRNSVVTMGQDKDYKVNRDLVEAVFKQIKASDGNIADTSIMGRLKIINNVHLTVSELIAIKDPNSADIKNFNDTSATTFSTDGFSPSNDSKVKFSPDCSYAAKAIYHVMMDAEADGDITLLDSSTNFGLSGISDNISTLERVSKKLHQILDDDAIKNNSDAVYAFYYNLFKKAERKLTGSAADSATPVVYKSATILNAIADDMLNENPKTKGIFENVWSVGGCIKDSSAHKDLMSDLLRRVIFPVEIWYGVLDLDTTSAADIKKGMTAELKYTRVAKILAGINYSPKDLYDNVASESGAYENTMFSSEDASNAVVKTDNDTLFNHLAVYTAAELYGAKSDYFDAEGKAMPGGLTKAALDHIVNNYLLDEDELKSIAYIVKETSIGSGRSYTSTVKAVAFVHVYEDPLTKEEALGYGTGFERNEAGDIVEKIAKWTP